MINNILYTTHCPRCKILKQKLNNSNIEYQECDDIDKMISLNISSVPAFYTEKTGLMDFG